MTTINNNLMAITSGRHLSSNYLRLASSVERLSSGLRVNSAADDAAGLAIRELMRSDVAALQQGMRNANDAISLLEAADGALGVIDEKLIRMKELAEQAATGTYDFTQRLMINSEFLAMAAEIDRIARSTEFNGIHLLDGSLSGAHDGSGLNSAGKMKIHFGVANDSAEDYYYIEIADCTVKGLDLGGSADGSKLIVDIAGNPLHAVGDNPYVNSVKLNDFQGSGHITVQERLPLKMQDVLANGVGVIPVDGAQDGINNFMMIIPKGTKNVLINTLGADGVGPNQTGDNDIALFTKTGIHLAGTPLDDLSYDKTKWPAAITGFGTGTSLDDNSAALGFGSDAYDGSVLNTGNPVFDPSGATLNYTKYNGMTIGYSGDPERFDASPNDGFLQTWADYEILTIDEVTEDLILWLPGHASAYVKAYWDSTPDPNVTLPDVPESFAAGPASAPVTIETQEKAQKALVQIDNAIVSKDKIRAHLGAMQNRLENTVANISIQAENLQAAESRISDVDVAQEMTEFVRNQVLTQAATAMLGQANSYPHMLINLIQS